MTLLRLSSRVASRDSLESQASNWQRPGHDVSPGRRLAGSWGMSSPFPISLCENARDTHRARMIQDVATTVQPLVSQNANRLEVECPDGTGAT